MSPKGGASTATSGGDFSCISPGGREELVGKRFLLVASSSGKSSKSPPKLSRISEWNWKAGVIRCASHVDSRDPELQILVERDDVSWDTREWLNVYKDNYQLLAVEHKLVLANRSGGRDQGNLWPALTFKPLVDTPGLYKTPKGSKLPVEFLSDLKLDFQDCNKLKVITHWDSTIPGLNTSTINEEKVNDWSDMQRSQHLMISFATYLCGMRIRVYRAEGTTQWYTAVSTGYNANTQEYTLTDDTVLEEHYEDPRSTQMNLLGGRSVIESILRGDIVTTRRSRSSVGQQSQQPSVPLSPSTSLATSSTPSNSSRARSHPLAPPLSSPSSSSEKGSVRRSSAKKQLVATKDADSSSETSSSGGSSSPHEFRTGSGNQPSPRPRGRPAKKNKLKKLGKPQQDQKSESEDDLKKDIEDEEEENESASVSARSRSSPGSSPKKKPKITKEETIDQDKVNQEDIDDELEDSKPLIQVRSQNRSNRKLKQLNEKQRNLTAQATSDKSDKLDTDSKVTKDKKINVANAEKQTNVEKDESDISSKETDQKKPHGNRGRKLQRVKNNKKESLEESLDLESSEETSDSSSAKKAEKPAPPPPASLTSSKAGTAPASATGLATASASEGRPQPGSPVSDEEQPVGSLRKGVSKRTASVAALAAISDSTVKEAIEDEELFKPLSPILVEAKSRPETGSAPTSGSSSSPQTGNQKRAVAIVKPQPQQVISVSGKNNNNSLTQPPVHRESIDREARFSLYDFPSDSEGEDGRPSSSASSPSKQLSQGKKSSPKPGFKSKQQPFSSACSAGTKPKIFPVSKTTALNKKPQTLSESNREHQVQQQQQQPQQHQQHTQPQQQQQQPQQQQQENNNKYRSSSENLSPTISSLSPTILSLRSPLISSPILSLL